MGVNQSFTHLMHTITIKSMSIWMHLAAWMAKIAQSAVNTVTGYATGLNRPHLPLWENTQSHWLPAIIELASSWVGRLILIANSSCPMSNCAFCQSIQCYSVSYGLARLCCLIPVLTPWVLWQLHLIHIIVLAVSHWDKQQELLGKTSRVCVCVCVRGVKIRDIL